jgi:hypothetical protein
METIVNAFEQPIEDKAIKELENHPALQEQILVSDLTSSDLEKCEKTVQMCDGISGVVTLASALGIRHIIENQMYKPEYQTSAEYFADSENRLHMDRRKVSRLYQIGDGYFRYRGKLHDAGFRPDKDVSKLQHLVRAIQDHGESAAIKALCSMSVREFQDYVRGPVTKQLNYTKLDLKVELSENGISVEGKEVIKNIRCEEDC